MRVPRSVVYFGWLLICLFWTFQMFQKNIEYILWYIRPPETHELICEQLFSYQEDSIMEDRLIEYDCHIDWKNK